MTLTPEARYRGGMTTLERYGREHYSRISKGRPRRPRLTRKEEEQAARPAGFVSQRGAPGR